MAFGAPPGGLPAGMDMGMLQRLQSDPEFMQLMMDPEIQPLVMQMQSNPAQAQQMMMQNMHNPAIQRFAQVIQRHMGGNPGNSGWGSSVAAPQANTNQDIISIQSGVQLETYIRAKNKLIVIDFTMHGCRPCANIAPTYERLASVYKGRATFLKIMSSVRDVCGKYNVSGFPTFVLLYNGEEVERLKGGGCAQMLEAKIDKWVQASAVANIPKSPYVHFPVLREKLPRYAKANLNGMKKKIIELSKAMDGPGQCSEVELSTFFASHGKTCNRTKTKS